MPTNARLDDSKVDVSPLAKSIKLPVSGKSAPNAFLKAAMTERLSSWDQNDPTKRGTPSDELVRVYEEWGKGGFGIILSGNTIVDPINLEAPGNIIFHKSVATPEHAKQFQKLAQGAKAGGALFVVQLSHGGRQVADFLQPDPVSASDIKLDDRLGMSFAKPHAATKEEIKQIIEDFAYAAEYAYKNGADGIQVHAAHGYLPSQFLSSSTNHRTDEYGGSIDNRARFIYEIFEAIKKRVTDKAFSLSIKLNSVEFQKGGIQPEEAAAVCGKLNDLGLDWVELSGGTYEELAFGHKRDSTKAREAFFLDFAEIIRPKAGQLKIWTTGGFVTAKAMASAVSSGATDGIGLARPVTQDFDLPKLILEGKVSSARKTLLDYNDFGITNVAAGTQIRQVGKGLQPFDASDEKQVKEFQEVVGAFFKKLQEDGAKGIVSAGYPDLPGPPYLVSA